MFVLTALQPNPAGTFCASTVLIRRQAIINAYCFRVYMPDWVSANRYEGLGLQFDLATNKYFDNHLNPSVAYGLKDATYKGKAEVKYFFSRTPWSSIDVYYKKDLDDGQVIRPVWIR
jgi:hypothetical protein